MINFHSAFLLFVASFFLGLPNNSVAEKLRLKFKVSGRELLDKGIVSSSDPYYIVSLSEDGGNSKKQIGESDTIDDQLNPDWSNVFDIHFDRNKEQYLYFHVWNKNKLRQDDTLGRVWINVADYVDKGQMDSPNLDKGGYLIIKSANGEVGTGELPLPAGTPHSEKLKFMLSASNLPSKDDVIGVIPKSGDPYVTIAYIDGPDGSVHEVGKTSAVSSTRNPSWNDVMTFHWTQSKNQRLRFRIYDEDVLRADDHLGQAWLEVNDYVAKGQDYTLLLPKQGTLTIRKA